MIKRNWLGRVEMGKRSVRGEGGGGGGGGGGGWVEVLHRDIPIATRLKGNKAFFEGQIIKTFTAIPWLPMF